MCVSKGAPKKPAYGPCNERHGGVGIGTVGATALYNGPGSGYYWSNSTTADSSAGTSTAGLTISNIIWTTA